jgi:hypothetical protein
MRAEVAERAIVRRVTMKDTTATDVRCVHAIIVPPTAAIKVGKATSPAKVISLVKAAINLVPAIIAKVVISREKVAIVLATIVKADISQEKVINPVKAISLVKAAISLVPAIIAMEKLVINRVKAVTISVLVQLATILMLSIA